MKNNKIIILLGISILLVIVIDITLILYFKNMKDVKIKYNCVGNNVQKKIADTEFTYQEINRYEFYVTKDNVLESGAIISQFVFKNEEEYNVFLEKIDKESKERIKEYDKDNLMMQYTFSNTFPNMKEEDKFHYTEEYLKQMEEKGFYCKKID